MNPFLITAMVLPVGYLLALGGWGIWSQRWRWQKPTAAATAVATLLRADPTGWARDSHVWSHSASRLNIWVGNDDYGLRWWIGDRNGYNVLHPCKADQQHVWRTLKPIRAGMTQELARHVYEALKAAPLADAAAVEVKAQ